MQTLISILAIIFLVVVIICGWKTVEYFNTLPDSNKWKGLLAWDVLIMFLVAIALIIRIVTM